MCIYLFMSTITCQMAARIPLKIGRCDIQAIENNLAMPGLSTPHCSSVVIERSPKEMHSLSQLLHQRDVNTF